MRPRLIVCVGVLLLGTMLPPTGSAQRSTGTAGQEREKPSAGSAKEASKGAVPAASGRTADSNDPKRAKLIADTRRLLSLSREVKAEMAKSGPDTLSLAMVKKVEELQKLAATVKAELAKTP